MGEFEPLLHSRKSQQRQRRIDWSDFVDFIAPCCYFPVTPTNEIN